MRDGGFGGGNRRVLPRSRVREVNSEKTTSNFEPLVSRGQVLKIICFRCTCIFPTGRVHCDMPRGIITPQASRRKPSQANGGRNYHRGSSCWCSTTRIYKSSKVYRLCSRELKMSSRSTAPPPAETAVFCGVQSLRSTTATHLCNLRSTRRDLFHGEFLFFSRRTMVVPVFQMVIYVETSTFCRRVVKSVLGEMLVLLILNSTFTAEDVESDFLPQGWKYIDSNVDGSRRRKGTAKPIISRY